jgi:hypothetical protein
LSGIVLAFLALVGTTSPARAAELTRAEYVERAEVVCEQTATKAVPALKVGLRKLKANEVIASGAKLIAVAAFNDKARKRLQQIPRPPDDRADLSDWLGQLGAQNRLLRKAGEELSAEHRVQAQGFLSRFVHSGNVANDTVLGFGFKHCLFDSNLK